jgi:3-oxoacyl-[acyl-carrier-protein] synthase-3
MSGNASYRLANTTVLSVCAVEAPIVATSASFDERLSDTYARVEMRPGMLEELAGVRERRWWPEDVSFADAAAMAGAKALAEAGIRPEQIGVMINTSVSRPTSSRPPRWRCTTSSDCPPAASTSTWPTRVSASSTASSWPAR